MRGLGVRMIPASGATDYVKFSTLQDEIFTSIGWIAFPLQGELRLQPGIAPTKAGALAKPGRFP